MLKLSLQLLPLADDKPQKVTLNVCSLFGLAEEACSFHGAARNFWNRLQEPWTAVVAYLFSRRSPRACEEALQFFTVQPSMESSRIQIPLHPLIELHYRINSSSCIFSSHFTSQTLQCACTITYYRHQCDKLWHYNTSKLPKLKEYTQCLFGFFHHFERSPAKSRAPDFKCLMAFDASA